MYLWPIRDLNILCVEVTLHVTEVACSSPPLVHFFQSSIQAFPFPLRVALFFLFFFCANGVSRNPWKMIQDRIRLLSRDPERENPGFNSWCDYQDSWRFDLFFFWGQTPFPLVPGFRCQERRSLCPRSPWLSFFAEVLLNRNIKWLHLSFSSENSALSEFSRKFLLEFLNY